MIYIHVPFCRHKCSYCDFVSGTNIGLKQRYLDALAREIDMRCDGSSDTLYMGGGTPSMLSVEDVAWMRERVGERIDLSGLVEWTVECNPEDMTDEWLAGLRMAGVNRLSIGVQSLDDNELRWMERRHTGQEALDAVRRAQSAGFDNISCDIIFGVPGDGLERTVDGILSLGVQHISAYSLMMEEGSKITKKGIHGVDEERSAMMYKFIVERLREHGFIHYEISNWSLPGYESRHNSGYWTLRPYIGLGPGAHSYDGSSIRRWNIGNTLKYCSLIESGECFWESEQLTDDDRFNEFIMLSLRRREGVDLSLMASLFGTSNVESFLKSMRKFSDHINISDTHCSLTEEGVYLSDMIISEGFI